VLNRTYNFQTLVSGGNPDLVPQSAKTWSAGFVVEPERLPNLRLSLNWYRISYRDKISRLTFRDLPGLESLFPESIVRSSTPLPGESIGRITQIRQGSVNVSQVKTSGIDANLSYRLETAIGGFDAALAATHVLHYRTQFTPASPIVEAVDTAVNPKSWEGTASLFYSRGHFSVGPWVSYTHSYRNTSSGTLGIKLSSMTTTSLQASYEYPLSSDAVWLRSLGLAAGLYNAFDKMPSANGTASGFDFTEGDLRGRQYYVTLTARF
jgi:outer membrane receptor protein involved in Fe transport